MLGIVKLVMCLEASMASDSHTSGRSMTLLQNFCGVQFAVFYVVVLVIVLISVVVLVVG